MPSPRINIVLSAGTAQFVADMDRAQVKVRDFGGAQHGMVSSMQASSGALRLLEGNFQNNIRAVERFIATTLGAGEALKAIFPIVGAVASIGILAKLGEEAYKFFRTVQDAPEKARGEFGSLNATLHTTNDELLLANAKLDNQIAKLEGKRQNTLKVALDEARVAADHLAASLEKDIQNLNKLLKQEEVGVLRQLFGGEAGTKDITRESGGRTGFGGFSGDIAKIREDSSKRFDAASTPTDKNAAQAQLQIALTKRYQEELEKVNKELKEGPGISVSKSLTTGGLALNNDSARVELLTQRRRFLESGLQQVPLEFEKEKKTEKVTALQAGRDNERLDKPFRDRIAKLKAEITGIQLSSDAIGKDQQSQVLAKALAATAIAIEEINKANERRHGILTQNQAAEIRSLEITKANLEADKEFKASEQSLNTSTEIRISSLYQLADAIGKGYEATKKANVETKLISELGEKAKDQNFLERNAETLSKRRNALGGEYDTENANKITSTVDRLGDQIELEKRLAIVQQDGAEAVRLAALAFRLDKIAKDQGVKATEDLIKSENDLYAATRANLSAEAVAVLKQKTEAIERLTKAESQGAEAVRRQALEERYSEAVRSGAKPGEIAGMRGEDEALHQRDITAEAYRRVNAYKDQLEQINIQISKLNQIQATEGATVNTVRALRDLEDERLHTLAQQSLSLGTAKDGVRAFFLEMQTQAQYTSHIIYTALNSAVDRVTENLAKGLTGQKTNFGQAFKGIAEEYLQSTIKQQVKTGIGALGGLFGIKAPVGPPKGTQSDPIWVQMANAGMYGMGAGIPSISGGLSGLGSRIGGIGGLIIKNLTGQTGSMSKTASTGTGNVTYNVDARGAQNPAVTALLVKQALEATHASAIAKSVLAVAERSFRIPGGSSSVNF